MHPVSTLRLLSFVAVAALVACPPAGSPDAGLSVEPKLSAIVEDIFQPRCGANACHGGNGPGGNLNLEQDVHANLVGVDADTDPSVKRVVAGDPEASLLYRVLLGPSNGVAQMPVGAELEAYELDAIRTWIEDGAADD